MLNQSSFINVILKKPRFLARLLECPREKRVEQLGALDAVTDVRGYGLLAGVDIRTDGTPGQAGDRMVAMVEDVLREF